VTREEVFVVLEGTAEVEIAGERSTARAGDSIVVPANTTFSLSNAGDSVLVALCCKDLIEVLVSRHGSLPSIRPAPMR
jgi:mannose-6-phosphate isomerase-like protein (cupin superfamily)